MSRWISGYVSEWMKAQTYLQVSKFFFHPFYMMQPALVIKQRMSRSTSVTTIHWFPSPDVETL
jgi:hypothetical protein